MVGRGDQGRGDRALIPNNYHGDIKDGYQYHLLINTNDQVYEHEPGTMLENSIDKRQGGSIWMYPVLTSKRFNINPVKSWGVHTL